MILADENIFNKYNLSAVNYIDEKAKNSNKFFDIIKREEEDDDDDDDDVYTHILFIILNLLY